MRCDLDFVGSVEGSGEKGLVGYEHHESSTGLQFNSVE